MERVSFPKSEEDRVIFLAVSSPRLRWPFHVTMCSSSHNDTPSARANERKWIRNAKYASIGLCDCNDRSSSFMSMKCTRGKKIGQCCASCKCHHELKRKGMRAGCK